MSVLGRKASFGPAWNETRSGLSSRAIGSCSSTTWSSRRPRTARLAYRTPPVATARAAATRSAQPRWRPSGPRSSCIPSVNESPRATKERGRSGTAPVCPSVPGGPSCRDRTPVREDVPRRPAEARGRGVLARRAEQISLHVTHAQPHERVELGLLLYALGDEDGVHRAGEVHEQPHQGLLYLVQVDVAHQREVDLDELGPQLEDVLQARVARAGIVDRQPQPCRPRPAQRRGERLVVL